MKEVGTHAVGAQEGLRMHTFHGRWCWLLACVDEWRMCAAGPSESAYSSWRQVVRPGSSGGYVPIVSTGRFKPGNNQMQSTQLRYNKSSGTRRGGGDAYSNGTVCISSTVEKKTYTTYIQHFMKTTQQSYTHHSEHNTECK